MPTNTVGENTSQLLRPALSTIKGTMRTENYTLTSFMKLDIKSFIKYYKTKSSNILKG